MADNIPYQRVDTTICSHLRSLLASFSPTTNDLKVKIELNDDAVALPASSSSTGDLGGSNGKMELERRFVQVIQWGAKGEGSKRRKVCHLFNILLSLAFGPFLSFMPNHLIQTMGLFDLSLYRLHVSIRIQLKIQYLLSPALV